MKYLFTSLFSLCFILSYGQGSEFFKNLDKSNGLANASIGISIKEIDGKEIFSHNADLSLTPASTLKILTTATALELLGSSHQFPTDVVVAKNNRQHIIVRGFGDPTLGSEFSGSSSLLFLNTWVDRISKTVSKNQLIDITVDDSYFGYQGVSMKWLFEDLGNYYASASYGVSFLDNTYRLYLNTMQPSERMCPIIVKTEPSIPGLKFDNQLTIKNGGSAYINGFPGSDNRLLTGSVPAKQSSYVLKGDIPDPGYLLGTTLASRLEQAGYTIGKVKTTKADYQVQNCNVSKNSLIPQFNLIYRNLSPSLGDIIKIVNVKSNNHYAEHLIRAIGRFQNQDIYSDALAVGIKTLTNFWKSKGLNTQSLHMYDGSGLAPSNSVSPSFITDVLIYMNTKSPYADTFFNSLPVAGRSGTVIRVLTGTRLEGLVSLKSGSIANVQCFAGYYFYGNKKYVFAIMVNDFNSPPKNVVKAIESILLNYLS